MEKQVYDVVIVGGGPAGLTSALYTSRARLNTLVIGGQSLGGQLMWTTEVENFPGFPNGIQGPKLIENFRKQAERFGTKIVEENVIKVEGSLKSLFTIRTSGETKYYARAVVIATGASAKWLPLDSVERLKGKGVSACAVCDAFFFKGKIVAVVGGGDAAMEEAIYLTKFSPKVYVLVRKDREGLRASEIVKEEAFKNDKIDFLFNTQVKEVLGSDSVEGIKVINNKTDKESVLGDVRGLFIAIGHKPNTDFLKGFIKLGKKGYIEPVEGTKTSKEGVFVAGDVGDWKYRQAITAAGFGCMAALDVEKFLKKKG